VLDGAVAFGRPAREGVSAVRRVDDDDPAADGVDWPAMR
jgi:hypothetical protein